MRIEDIAALFVRPREVRCMGKTFLIAGLR